MRDWTNQQAWKVGCLDESYFVNEMKILNSLLRVLFQTFPIICKAIYEIIAYFVETEMKTSDLSGTVTRNLWKVDNIVRFSTLMKQLGD